MATPENEGLSLGYRIRWRIIYTLLFVLGPAQQTGMNDPHVRMRAERAARVERARVERTQRARLAAEEGADTDAGDQPRADRET